MYSCHLREQGPFENEPRDFDGTAFPEDGDRKPRSSSSVPTGNASNGTRDPNVCYKCGAVYDETNKKDRYALYCHSVLNCTDDRLKYRLVLVYLKESLGRV